MGMMYSVASVDCGDGRKIKVAIVGELIRTLVGERVSNERVIPVSTQSGNGARRSMSTTIGTVLRIFALLF
jgi:hypothetical protein